MNELGLVTKFPPVETGLADLFRGHPLVDMGDFPVPDRRRMHDLHQDIDLFTLQITLRDLTNSKLCPLFAGYIFSQMKKTFI